MPIYTWLHYTAHAQNAIYLAQREVEQQGGNQVDAEHILLGVVTEPGAEAVPLLRHLGVSPDQVQTCLRSRLPTATHIPAYKETQLSPSAKFVVRMTLEEASRLKSENISTAHLLLGVLSAAQPSGWSAFPFARSKRGDRLAAAVLHELGVTLERVEQAMREADAATLLRVPADPAPFATLLRPAQAGAATRPDELLRASETETSKPAVQEERKE